MCFPKSAEESSEKVKDDGEIQMSVVESTKNSGVFNAE